MQWKNELTEILKVQYPIIQAPMLGVTTPEMVAAISNNGGLGSLPVGGLSPEKTIELIHKTKSLTDKPFAVNLFVHNINVTIDKTQIETMQNFLYNLCSDNNLSYKKLSSENIKFYSYREQIDILINENIPIISFTFGIPDDQSITRLRANNVILLGTATSLKEAELLDEKKIDIITAQGIEAGGHRGTFIDNEPLPMIEASLLVKQIINNINRPVIFAGGIHNGEKIKEAFSLGAEGVQIGTAFIASNESAAINSYKDALKSVKDEDIVLTRAVSGRWAKGIKNKLIKEVENSNISIPVYPIQNTLTTPIRAESQKQNNKDFTPLWAGNYANKAEAKSAAEIFKKLIKETE